MVPDIGPHVPLTKGPSEHSEPADPHHTPWESGRIGTVGTETQGGREPEASSEKSLDP